MRSRVFLSLAVLASFAVAGENSELLSKYKKEKLSIEKQKNELKSDNLKNDWLNPVT